MYLVCASLRIKKTICQNMFLQNPKGQRKKALTVCRR
nr:MAG TPA: hypothetical protein [Caudoviricetes sp.]